MSLTSVQYRGTRIHKIATDEKGKIDRNTIIEGDFNILLTSMDRFSRQKINKAREILYDKIGQLDLIDWIL